MKMYLSREMERMLDGEYGVGKQMAMKVLVALGDSYNAEKMVRIKSAHISGASYDTVGEHGLHLIKEMSSDCEVVVKTTLNPIGFDRDFVEEIDEDFYAKQMELLQIFQKMGVELTCTCTPYYHHNLPKFGEIVAWAESSAIIYINSLVGARTNRESGFSSLCSAITGYTPYHSLLIEENRAPNFVVKVKEKLNPGMLGLYIGKEFQGIPYIVFDYIPDEDYLKLMGAAMGASGNISMFHAEDITPEHNKYDTKGLERVEVEKKDLEDLTGNKDFEAVVFGCPHLSEREIADIVKILGNREVVKPIYLYTSRGVMARMRREVEFLRRKGVRVLADTCMVVSPLLRGKYRKIATNSGKAYHYLRSKKFGGFEVYLGNTEELLYDSTR